MAGFPGMMLPMALRAGWTELDILDLHEWALAGHNDVTSIVRDLAIIDGRWVHYRGLPLKEINTLISRRLDPDLPIHIYADGSGTTADKPSGYGVVVLWPGEVQLIGESCGLGTNNHAELSAIQRALRAVPDTRQTIVIHSDSEWAMGAARPDSTWNVSANARLVSSLREELRDLRSGPGGCRVQFEHVQGHAGVLWNEVADRLARSGRLGEPPKFPRKMQRALEAYQP